MSDVYLSDTGSDSNPGTESQPWRTIAKLNSELAAGLGPGDSIHFERGSRFYGCVNQPGTADHDREWTIFRPYGRGPRPQITAYKVSIPGAWTDQGDGTWRLDLRRESGAYTGNVNSDKTEAGHLLVDGVIHGRRYTTQASVTAGPQWGFRSAGGYLYVKSTADPSTLARTVAVAPFGPWTAEGGNPDLFTAMSKTQIIGLDLSGVGGTGVTNSSYWTPKHVRVWGNKIHRIGGASYDGGGGTVRGGNGVQAWIGCEDWLIEHNEISQCYDVAVSYQGGQGVQVAGNTAFRNLHARYNLIYDNCQSFETWNEGTTGDGFVDCSFTDNLCFGAGRGWGQSVRSDPNGRGCHLLFYQHQLPNDLLVARNAFYDASTNYMFALNGVPDGVELRDNKVFLAPGTLVQTSTISAGQRPETVEQATDYTTTTGHEQGTQWFTTSDYSAADAALADVPHKSGKALDAGRILLTPDQWRRPDIVTPTTPTGLTATAGDGRVDLTWNASTDDRGVVDYRLRRDGAIIATQAGRTFADTPLSNGVQRSYTVTARDAAGNESNPSAAVTATPQGTAADPPHTPDAYYDARYPLGRTTAQPADGAQLLSLVDLSGNARNLTSNTTNGPTYRRFGQQLPDAPCISFDGVNDYLTRSGYGTTTGRTVYAVTRVRGSGKVFTQENSFGLAAAGTGGALVPLISSTGSGWSTTATATISPGADRATIVMRAGGDLPSRVRVNGVTGTDRATYSQVGGNANSWRLGAAHWGSGQDFYTGDTVAVLVYLVAHTDAQIAEVEAWIAAQNWSTTPTT